MSTPTLQDRLAAETFALDMAGLRALANSVFHGVHDGARVDQLPFGRLHHDAIQATGVDNSLFFPRINPWPHDTAADLLAAWRAA